MVQQDYDALLRPRSLDHFVGQAQIKTVLNTVITAARILREPVGHILLSGPAGMGQTTLAHVVANEMGCPYWATTGTNLATQLSDHDTLFKELFPIFEHHGVVFVDEIHRASKSVQYSLLPLLERNELALRYRAPKAGFGVRKGDWIALSGKTEPFTFIAATNRLGLLLDLFSDRFNLNLRLDYYNDEDMFQIARRSARLLELDISDAALRIIAQASRGTPRIGNDHIWCAKQWAVAHRQYIDTQQAETILAELDIDSLGLTEIERRLLAYLIELDRPAGLATIAAYLAENRHTVEWIIEPPLIRAELLIRTARGRTASEKAKQHLKRGSARDKQGD
jgi:Holliday junction DNA helicase RuvB